MVIITAHKHSISEIRFEFQGPAAHIDVARAALETGSITHWIDTPTPTLIGQVSPSLLKAIASLNMIETVDGTPFVPLFIPAFGHGQKTNEPL